MQVPFLGPEDPPEEGNSTHSSILAWEAPKTEEPGRLQSTGCKELDTTAATEQARTHRQKNEILPAVSKLVVKSSLFYWNEINSF